MSTLAQHLPDLHEAPAAREPRPGWWIQGFIVLLLVCQVLLLFPEIGGARVLVRGAAFGASLLLLVLLRGRGARHPAAPFGMGIVALVILAMVHPGTTNPVSGGAQAALYLAVLAPLFWAARLRITVRTLSQALFVLWAFHTVSAALGVLQVIYPGEFQPALSTIVTSKGKGYLESLMIVTATGQKTFRPMGLYDVPGAAAVSAMYAILLGTGFLLTRRGIGMWALAAGSMTLGMTCMYLSQVRSALVMTGISLVALAAILAARREVGRLARLAAVVVGIVVIGYSAAQSLAGPQVTRRLSTLVAGRPGQVYYQNRGAFLEDVFTKLVPEYPLGGGLGHWGMMASYFGRPEDASRSVWVEIQWAGWVVDGGLPLMLVYPAAIVVAILTAWSVSRRARKAGNPELSFWAAVVLAYSVGLFALTFSYPVFIGQPGMEFWLLNAALFGAARSLKPRQETAA